MLENLNNKCKKQILIKSIEQTMQSKSPQLKPFQTQIVLSAPYTRKQLSNLAETASDGYYANAVQKTEDKQNFLVTFYTFDEQDANEMRGRLILLSELMDMDDIEILSATFGPCPEKNWLEEVHQAFPPRAIGKFYVFGSHVNETEISKGLIPLKIDAATAFGSGEHDTTQLCLEALSNLDITPENILDMGCGSGILAIGAAKIWGTAHIIGTDIDEESVRVSGRHANMNDTPDVTFDCGDGYKMKIVQNHAPYDLIIANILTRPLIAMAPDAARVAKTGTRIILSGLLDRQADDVIAAYQKNGFEFITKNVQNNWACLILKKK